MSSADERMKDAHLRLKIRAEMKSAGEDEDSAVIEREALSRRPPSGAPKERIAREVVKKLPGWGLVVVLLALIAAVTVAVLAGKLHF